MNTSSLRTRGFTLVEMVVAITLISLLALVAAPMLRLPLTAWLDATRRAEMTNSLEQINAKLADDLRRALPNSVRVRQVGNRFLLEMLEVRAWVRYREGASTLGQVCAASACDTVGQQDALNLTGTCPDTCFTSIGRLEGDTPVAGSDWVVVNPLDPNGPVGNPYFGGNVAVPGGIKTRLTSIALVNPDGHVLRIAAHTFSSAPASKRLYIVATPVTWDCDPDRQQTRRWNYPISAAQPTAFPPAANAAPMATQVGVDPNNTPCIRYVRAGSQGRGGLVHFALRLSVPAADTQVPEVAQWSATFAVSEGP
jgi:MSHA biogenesis protein MshO